MITNILLVKNKRKVFGNLEHLPLCNYRSNPRVEIHCIKHEKTSDIYRRLKHLKKYSFADKNVNV